MKIHSVVGIIPLIIWLSKTTILSINTKFNKISNYKDENFSKSM